MQGIPPSQFTYPPELPSLPEELNGTFNEL